MLDLNHYYPASNLPRLYRERNLSDDETKAMSAARLTVVACERAMQRNPNDPWIRPTLLGAAFDAGDVPKARKLLDEFNQAATAPFQLESTIPDLRRALSLLAYPETSPELASILGDFQRLLDPMEPLLLWREGGSMPWARKIAASHPSTRCSCRSVSATCWWQRRASAWFRRQLGRRHCAGSRGELA